MFHIKQELEQPDHLQRNSLHPSTSRLREHYSEVSPWCHDILPFAGTHLSVYDVLLEPAYC